MKTILIYILIGIITTGILELRLTLINKQLTWKERIVSVITYPATILNLFLNGKNGSLISGYLFSIWVIYQILLSL